MARLIRDSAWAQRVRQRSQLKPVRVSFWIPLCCLPEEHHEAMARLILDSAFLLLTIGFWAQRVRLPTIGFWAQRCAIGAI